MTLAERQGIECRRVGSFFLAFHAFNGSSQEWFQSGEFKIHTDVELVLLDVSVKNPSGGSVTGLTKDQFQIYENGVLQKISQFSAEDVPVAVGLVMDDSGSIESRRPDLNRSRCRFYRSQQSAGPDFRSQL